MKKIIFNNLKTEMQPPQERSAKLTGFSSSRDVLKKRSQKFIKIFSELDHDTLTKTHGFNALLEAVREEFGEAALADLPIGIVSKCYLGHPFEVHTLDLGGTQIIQHFKSNETMPGEFEKARTLAKHNAYCFIEVYKDKLVLIREDGTATKL